VTRKELKDLIRAGQPVSIPQQIFDELLEEVMSRSTTRDAEPVTLMESTGGSPHARLVRAALQESWPPTSHAKDADDAPAPAAPRSVDDVVALLRASAVGLTPRPAPTPRPARMHYDPRDVVLSEAQVQAGRARLLRGGAPLPVPAGAHARLRRAAGGY
jgi:hypothetical protein